MSAKLPSLDRVRELLNYSTDTGIFTWRIRRGGVARVGQIAGSDNGEGYLRIRIDGTKQLSHRLAWLYVHGVWPEYDIDHINGVRSDNKISNLRCATRSENAQNQSSEHRKKNGIGLIGVSLHKATKKFQASIKIKGKQYHLGLFKTPNDAHEAYLLEKNKIHPFSARLNVRIEKKYRAAK